MIDATPLLRGYAKLRQRRLARRSAIEQQRVQLMKLVRLARHTRFGKDHDFAAVRTVADYQDRVPLRRYEDFYERYFKEAFPVLDDVTWPGRVPYFAVSSGTSSGRTKYIPLTRAMLRSNSRAGTDLLAHHVRNTPSSRVLSGKSFMLGGSVAVEDLGHGIKSGDLSGIARLENPRWSEPFVFPSTQDAIDAEWDKKIDRLARLSLDEPIRCLAGTPSWLLLFFERLSDIAQRGHDVRAYYPDLDLLVYGGMSFAPYRDAFERWFPNGGTDFREVYPASEGFIASADRGPGEGMRLNTDIGLFYEFVPVDELDSEAPTRHWLGTVPAEGEFAIVVTTCAGLWSYIMGDVVRLELSDVPRVTVTGRTSYYLSAFGEHLSGEEIERAVLAAAAQIDASVSEFSVTPLYPDGATTSGRHRFVVELGEAPQEASVGPFSRALDRSLCEANEDYEVHRRGDYQLLAPDVAFVPPGAFRDWMQARGKLGGQNKVPRVVPDGSVREDLLTFAQERRLFAERGEETA